MYNAVTAWHHRQFAYMLGKMKGIDEGNGSLLDNTMLLYGQVSAMAMHMERRIYRSSSPGRRRHGALRALPQVSPQLFAFQIHLATMQRMGVPVEEFAEVDSPMSGLTKHV